MGLQLPEPFGTEPLTHHRVVVKDSTAELKQYPNLYETGTEDLVEEELRVTALGTGYPARRGQAAAGFPVSAAYPVPTEPALPPAPMILASATGA